MKRRIVLRVGGTCVAVLASSAFGAQAVNDTAKVKANATSTTIDVLANDDAGSAGSRLVVISVTPPAHGTATVAPGGLGVIYTPNAGYVGADSFQYTATNAMQVVTLPRQIIATTPGPGATTTNIYDGFGSSLAPIPGAPNDYWTITDRGPNVGAPSPPFGANDKIFPMPSFAPTIMRVHVANGVVTQVGSQIQMRDALGNLRSGRISSINPSGENGLDVNLQPLAQDPGGIDSEGVVAMPDGTFWVSDEYGPFIVHFAANGNTIEQLSPLSANTLGHKLPQVLATRLANKGMEGLTITASGERLIGMMQASLINGVSTSDGGKSAVNRVVTFDLVTDAARGYVAGATHQYLYMLDSPSNSSPTGAVSEIAMVQGSETDFYVDERDGKFPYDTSIANGGTGGAASVLKKLYRVSLTGATDVSDPLDSSTGKLFSGQTPEQLTNKLSETNSATNLFNQGVVAIGRTSGTTNATKTLVVDLLAELANIDPASTGLRRTFYAHDKVEGVAVVDGGRRIVFSNDDDFGVNDDGAGHVIGKATPAGVDITQLLVVDLNNLPATTTTGVVNVTVGANTAQGRLLMSRDVYSGTASTVTVGQTLPTGKIAVADGTYPTVFNNVTPDGNFGVTAPIFLDGFTVSGTTATLSDTLPIPTSQMVGSYSSKSEGSLNLSTDRQSVSIMGYLAPVNALDVSNSNTPNHVDPTNPDAQTFQRAVAKCPTTGSGAITVTGVNAYSGDNPRGAILDSVGNRFFMVGNSNNGSGTAPDVVVNCTGVQMVTNGTSGEATVVGQHFGTAGAANGSQYGFSVVQQGFAADKSGKDNNMRGLTIFNNTLYVAKGSGSNGINTVYQVGTAGTLPTPATASSTVFTILPGFPTALASAAGALHPFGIWFANANTLYVADEGDGTTTTAGTNPDAGLQKWVLSNGTWSRVYTLQAGLGLGQSYSVYGYSVQTTTAGLRNLTGQLNGDGTVTLYATTATVNGLVETGANPNRVVGITDTLSFTTGAQASGEQFFVLRTAEYGEVLRGVCFVQQFQMGDVGRHGGAPTTADVTTLLNIALGRQSIPLGMTTADLDMNHDGVIDRTDSTLLSYYVLGRIPYIPYP